MKGYGKIAAQITNLLRAHPRGMTITDISRTLALNRNSVAKYLEILVTSGQVDKERIGRAKLFFLSQRVPLSAMLNLSSDMILILDGDGKIWYVNENLLAFEARDREELIGRAPGDVGGLAVFGNAGVPDRPGAPLREESRREVSVTRGGRTLHLTVSLVPTTFEDGSRGITVIGADITERKQAEQALTESERRYRSLFENMMDGYIYCRVLFQQGKAHDLVYLAVNPAFVEITGLRDVVGRRVSEVIPGVREANPDIFEIYGRVAMTGKPERFETFMPGLGALYSVSVFSPEKEHIVAVFEDITERRRTDESLKEHLFFFQELLDRVPVPVFYKDTRGRYLGCNLAFEEYTRKSRGEILDRKATDVFPASLAEKFEAMDTTALGTGEVQSLEFVYPSREGTSREFTVFKAPYLNRDGSPAGIVGTIIDTMGRRMSGESLATEIPDPGITGIRLSGGPPPGGDRDPGSSEGSA